MMGLLGNVAEVKSLRPFLMTKEFVFEFSQLLDSHSDGIEVRRRANSWEPPSIGLICFLSYR